jgi:transcriptional regulator with XRE-family HTH domain
MTKRDTVDTFRRRLSEKIERSGLSRARFASRAGLSRSALSQLLLESNVRLPRAETIAQLAARHRCSADWLLGLSEQDQVAADVVPQMMIEPDAGDPADERLRRWHAEAIGTKIRYVPATLPDHLKTDAMIAYETGRLDTAVANAMTDVTRERIEHARRPESEIEVCSPLQDVVAFARGEGMWGGFPAQARREQIENMAQVLDRLYPSYRWYLFDARERFSVPYSVFGMRRAVIYVGDMYLVLTTTELIREFATHFDNLIRAARVQPNDTPTVVATLAREIR